MFPLQNYGRSIISLPHYNVQEDAISDPTYGESADVQGRAKAQALLLQHFWNRWRKEYLTAICEYHRATRNNA